MIIKFKIIDSIIFTKKKKIKILYLSKNFLSKKNMIKNRNKRTKTYQK